MKSVTYFVLNERQGSHQQPTGLMKGTHRELLVKPSGKPDCVHVRWQAFRRLSCCRLPPSGKVSLMDRRYLQAGLSIACIVTVTAVCSEALSLRDRLVEKIHSAQVTLVAAEQDLFTLKQQGMLGAREIASYEAWIRQMRSGLEQDCVQLYRSTDAPLPQDLPCEGGTLSGAAAADIDTIGEHTREEAIDELDNHLSRSLGEFDEKLLREQQRVKAGKPDSASDTATGTGAASSGDYTAEQVGGEDGEQATLGEQARSKDAGAGQSGHTGISSAPAGTPDGSDDDVVARQLREAAEAEQDPALKRKLWEEYRKYKQGIQ